MAISRRRPTSADVAARAGVSRTTVSFVLNDRAGREHQPADPRARVCSPRPSSATTPTPRPACLAGGKSHTLGFVLRQSAEQVAGDAALAETLRGLATAARAAGFRVMVEPLDPGRRLVRGAPPRPARRRSRRVRPARRRRRPRPTSPATASRSSSRDRCRVSTSPASTSTTSLGARRAVEHLIGLGRRRIAFITNAPLAYTAAQERRDGYRDALEAAGIAYDEELVAEAAFDAGSGHRAMAELLRRGPIDAAFVASDVVAFGAIAAIREAGLRVPAGRLHRRLRRHRAGGVLRPAPDHRAPAGIRPGPGGRDRPARSRSPDGRLPDRTLLPTELIVRSSTAPATG